ncbi:hypothetical protein [Alterinioella nitratireducens]
MPRGQDDRITPATELEACATALLSRANVAYVDVGSPRNTCFLTRITQSE